MRYISFRVENFKGIKDTTINLSSIAGANVFAFVGLNESGKTTILEAIHSFSPDGNTRALLGSPERRFEIFKKRVPRHQISTFTGDVSVTAEVSVSAEDKQKVIRAAKIVHEFEVDPKSFPDTVTIKRYQRFENGDYQSEGFELLSDLRIRKGKARTWRMPNAIEKENLRYHIYNVAPDIAYFPTFVFDFPETVYLTDRGGVVQDFYRNVFQDILDFDGKGLTIEKDIVRRIRSEENTVPWLNFWTLWQNNDDQKKIQHVTDRASAALTKMVFGRWNKIFKEDTRGKEIVISFQVVEGEIKDKQGTVVKTSSHDIAVKFQIKDGTRRFNVNDRSLGFRWFFSFMLFTQFRVAGSGSDYRPVLFLFDEPASNLHAAAQERLIESFPEIARGEHMLAYSTHSHYMIEPKWLEQTFIVTNRADAPVNSLLDEASLDDESLDIQATSYRDFVDKHPNHVSYFQPVLDRLEVVPSRFEPREASVVVEGKSDYYIIRYAATLLDRKEIQLMPALGAGTFGALAALHVGWNLKMLFVLDADKKGWAERKRYTEEFGIGPEHLVTINELSPDVTVIEDLFDNVALSIVQRELQIFDNPSKAQLKRFCQERLVSHQLIELGPTFSKRAALLVDAMVTRSATS